MAVQYKTYFKIPGGDWVNQENTYETEITISNTTLTLLDYYSIYQWRVDTYDDELGLTTTGDTWTFISQKPPFTDFNRRSDYDEDLVWNPETGDWDDINDFEYTGGGSYKNQIVIVGHGVVYFGDL